MTRPAITSLAILAALAAPALATDANAPALNATPAVSAIAPGGNISSVVQATETYGWPHSPTVNERYDVAQIVLLTNTPRNARVSVFCRFGFTMGRSTCALKIRSTKYRVAVRVFEDGSYTLTRTRR